jgi:hypothetical protein
MGQGIHIFLSKDVHCKKTGKQIEKPVCIITSIKTDPCLFSRE